MVDRNEARTAELASIMVAGILGADMLAVLPQLLNQLGAKLAPVQADSEINTGTLNMSTNAVLKALRQKQMNDTGVPTDVVVVASEQLAKAELTAVDFTSYFTEVMVDDDRGSSVCCVRFAFL